MRAWWFVCIVLAAGASLLRPAAAETKREDRVALLIGNAQYPDGDAPLTTPVQDVRALGAALQRKGYAVDLVENATKRAMNDALTAFLARIKPGSSVLFYFSGYGIQSARKNYLIPVDGQIWSEADLQRDGVTVDGVMAEIDRRGAEMKVVVLDAANRNPFERRFRSFSTGLAPTTDPPANTLLVHSTAPGTMLRPGTGTRSAFAEELIRAVGSDGLSRPAFDKTRAGVSAASQGAQVPWIFSTLKEGSGGGWSDPRPAAVKPPRQIEIVAATAPGPLRTDAAKPDPAKVAPEPARLPDPAKPDPAKPDLSKPDLSKSDTLKPADAGRLPETGKPPAIVAVLDPARDFATAKRTNTREAYQTFVARYPTGAWADRAQAEIDRLDAAARPAPASIPVLPYSREDQRMKADLDRALDRNPTDAAALYRRGQLHAIHREFQPALADFDEVIRLNPQDVEALNNRCWVRAMIEELDRALRDCNEALKLRPNFPDALDSRGLVNLKIGLPGMAIRDYDAALRGNGKQASSLYGRGLARLRTGDTQDGNSDISDALAMDPGVAKEFARYGIR